MVKRSRQQRIPSTLHKKLQIEKIQRNLSSNQDIFEGLDNNFNKLQLLLDEILGRKK